MTPEFLAQLDKAGLTVTESKAGEWFASLNDLGSLGPFSTAETALVGGVAWLVMLLQDATQDHVMDMQTVESKLQKALATVTALRATLESDGAH